MAQRIDRHLLAIATDVARALEGITSGDSPFGNYYVGRVIFGLEGDELLNVALVRDEYGTYAMEVSE